jgi:hypothetical protein
MLGKRVLIGIYVYRLYSVLLYDLRYVWMSGGLIVCIVFTVLDIQVMYGIRMYCT